MPDFGAHPTIVSVADGNWSNPSIWSAARVPTDHDVVSLAPNTSVSYDVISNAHVETVVIEAGAQLDFRTDLSTRLIVANFIVMAGGVLEVGSETDPVAAHVKAEILFSNQPLNTTFDPEQYGNGLIAMGTVTMHGAVKDDTFIRLAVEPRAGDTTLTLETPASGWQANDRLILPDSKQWARETRAYVPEWEEVRVASISADGKVVTLQTPLLYNHPGARNGDGVLEFLAHVGDLTRNVVVRSESSAGVRGDRSVISNYYEFVMGIWFGDYMTKDVVIRHADIQGVRTGIVDPYFGGSKTLIEDSYLRNTVDISTVTIGAPGSGPYGPSRTPKSLIVRNVQFGSTASWNHGGRTPYSIARSYELHDGSANLIASDTLYVYDYNGNPDDDFQVFYPQQQPEFIVPQASGNLAGSPEAGLTNQQNWDKYGIAIAGAVMPADAVARSGILGSVRPIVALPLPPVDHIVAVSPDPRTTAVASVDVVFAAPVDPNFFAWSNLTLRRNGGDNLINAAVTISALAADTFRIANLATLTGVEGDYVLTVEAGVGSKSEAWALDLTPPSVTVNQASNQADPTTDSPIQFAVVFSESVTGFAAADLQLSGTAAGSLVATVTGSGTTYNVAISGMTSGGTVQVAVKPDAAVDAAGNSSRSSTSIDNTVQFVVPGISVDVTLPAELNEGELLVAPGTISGSGPFTVVVDYGDQTAPETLPVANDGTFSLSHRYADNGNYSISLTATGKNGASDSEAASILVTNVAPQVTLSAPLDGFQGVRAQERVFEISATDASSTDQASLFTYSVDWGDGSGAASIVLASHGTVSHAYTSEGTYAVQVSAKDKDGATSAMFSRNVTIAVREVQGNDLAVGGTVGNDSFDVSPGSGAGKAIVRLNGVNLGTFTVPGAIRAFGGGGSDTVQATGSANSDTFAIRPNDLRMGALTMLGDSVEKWIARGGSGSDTFQDLGGTATLVGGRGADRLVAGPGSNDWSITNANQGLLNNRVAFSTIEYLVGGAGDDSFRLAEVGKISGRIEGAGGRNLLDYGVWTSDIYVNLSLGTAPNVSSFLQIQDVTGGSGSDTLIGDTNDNVLQGGAGNDIISGEAGNDTLDGNAGRDLLFGGLGGDSLVGSADEDLMAGGVLSYLAGGTSNINRTALNALRTEWIRADITYDARINNLLVGVGDTSIYRFAPETLADDGAVDSIFGSGEQAALDWALIGVGDTVSNLRTGSRVTRF